MTKQTYSPLAIAIATALKIGTALHLRDAARQYASDAGSGHMAVSNGTAWTCQ